MWSFQKMGTMAYIFFLYYEYVIYHTENERKWKKKIEILISSEITRLVLKNT